MGLTNDRVEAQTKIQTLQVLIDLGKFIKDLPSSDEFAQLSKVAYSLPEIDQAKADAGRATIAEIDSKLAEQRQNAKDLQDEQDNIDLRIKQLSDANDSLVADRKKVTERENVVGKREDAVTSREDVVSEREKNADIKESKLSERENKLVIDQDIFDQKQAEAKERADKIKQLSEGM